MYYYFAFGANMSSEVIKRRLPEFSFKRLGTAIIRGYRISFTSEYPELGGVGTLLQSDEDVVLGVVYSMNHAAISCLDSCEGFYSSHNRNLSFYTRETFLANYFKVIEECEFDGDNPKHFELFGCKIEIGDYVSVQAYIHTQGGYSPPGIHYVDILREGARENRLPPGYIRELCERNVVVNYRLAERWRGNVK